MMRHVDLRTVLLGTGPSVFAEEDSMTAVTESKSGTTETQTTPEGVLARVEELLVPVAAASAEVERARGLPADLLGQLKQAGCFRILLPKSHGGVGSTLPSAIDVFEKLATADASVAWTVMIGAAAWTDLVGLPRRTFDEVFAAGPDTVVSLVFSPSGTAKLDGDGWRVTGRWAFASGVEHADWFAGNTIDDTGDLRLALFEPSQVQIEDTWHVAGLRGTGSHHVTVADVLVAGERSFSVMHGEPCIDEPVGRLHPPALFSLSVASVALGIAEGALQDIAGLSGAKTPLLSSTTLRQSPTFHAEIAGGDTTVRAARAVLRETAELVWSAGSEGRSLTDAERARSRAAAAWVTSNAADIVASAYRAGGGGALYDDSPLQRRLRDVNAITQHFLVRPDTQAKAGALLLGEGIDLPIF